MTFHFGCSQRYFFFYQCRIFLWPGMRIFRCGLGNVFPLDFIATARGEGRGYVDEGVSGKCQSFRQKKGVKEKNLFSYRTMKGGFVMSTLLGNPERFDWQHDGCYVRPCTARSAIEVLPILKVLPSTKLQSNFLSVCIDRFQVVGGGGVFYCPPIPISNWGRAHYVMVSELQWKPFWLATQRDPQNDWTGCERWRMRRAPTDFVCVVMEGGHTWKRFILHFQPKLSVVSDEHSTCTWKYNTCKPKGKCSITLYSATWQSSVGKGNTTKQLLVWMWGTCIGRCRWRKR